MCSISAALLTIHWSSSNKFTITHISILSINIIVISNNVRVRVGLHNAFTDFCLHRFFWANRFFCFSYSLFFVSVLCVRLSWPFVNFWAHVNISYRNVNTFTPVGTKFYSEHSATSHWKTFSCYGDWEVNVLCASLTWFLFFCRLRATRGVEDGVFNPSMLL